MFFFGGWQGSKIFFLLWTFYQVRLSITFFNIIMLTLYHSVTLHLYILLRFFPGQAYKSRKNDSLFFLIIWHSLFFRSLFFIPLSLRFSFSKIFFKSLFIFYLVSSIKPHFLKYFILSVSLWHTWFYWQFWKFL